MKDYIMHLVRMNKMLILLSCIISLYSFEAFAIPSLQPKLKNNQFKAGIAYQHYLTNNNEATAGERKGNLGIVFDWRGVGNKKNFRSILEVDALYGLQKNNYRYVNIGEAFLGLSYPAQDFRYGFYLGRKREIWNEIDSYWTLGIFQPRFRWDYLNEKENGLFGFFTNLHSNNVKIHAYYSPLFIPEQGAPTQFIDGNCRTSSPWFICPSSSVALFNQSTPIYFRLDVPPLKKIIFHSGYGGSLKLGDDQGAYIRGSFAHKPINQFLLAYEGVLDLSTLQLPATLYPRILMHDVYSLDAGVEGAFHSLSGSLIWENPKRDITPDSWNTQETTNAFYAGLIAKTSPFHGQFTKTKLEFSILHREGGVANDKGPFAKAGNSIFEPRQPFQQAYSFAIFTPILDKWDLFQFSSKFILDTARNGNILISDIFYKPFKKGTFNIGLDLLGSQSITSVDFISRYQRNDRIRGAFIYAF